MSELKRWAKMKILQLLVLAIAMMVTSCRNNVITHKQAVTSGRSTLPWPNQMVALFGDADHFITHFGFPSGAGPWNTEVYFGGRYSLTLQFEIQIDYEHGTVRAISPPKFFLFEIQSLKRRDHTFEASYSHQWVIDEAQWDKLVAAKGDWSVLGITLSTGSPLPDFDEFVRIVRAPRAD